MSLAYNKDKISADEYKKLEQSLQEAGDYYLKVEKESAYGTAYPGHTYDTTVTDIVGDSASERSVTLTGGYEWGSNSMVINNALVMGVAYDVTKDTKYLSGATTAMGYIFGNNPLENSYVTGYGTNTTQYPHHRYWCPQMKAGWPYAPDGCLSGGPNSDMNDPLIQGAGYKIGELAPMKCYLDKNDAWSVNEITINWNAPLVWMAAFAEEEAPKADSTTPSTPDGDILYGDADNDGDVDIIDVLKLNQYLLSLTDLPAQGLKNADVDRDTKLNDSDAINILKSLVDLVKLPVK
jgi:endoglucanase